MTELSSSSQAAPNDATAKFLQILNELRIATAATHAGDASAAARVDQLLGELEQLAANFKHTPTPHGADGSLGDAIREFEVQHPQATAVVERLLLVLSSMGI